MRGRAKPHMARASGHGLIPLAADPDHDAGWTVAQLKDGMAKIYAKRPNTFAANEGYFEETMLRLLSKQDPEMVIVPSNSLYIEALPGTHPLLEDFKLMHRAEEGSGRTA
jgi:hypothetical protein